MSPDPVSTRPPRPTAVEVATVLAIVVVAAVWTAYVSRDMWFAADFWGLLTMRDLSLSGILTPHGGHLTVYHALATHLGYAAFGMEPWFFVILRVLAWSGLVVTMWYSMRARGADGVWALVAVGAMSVLGISGWLMGWLVGNPIAIALGILATLVVERNPDPGSRDVAVVGLLLLGSVVGTSLGLAALAAVGAVVVFDTTRRAYLLSVSAVAVGYAAWFLAFRFGEGSGPSIDLSIGTVARLPLVFVEVLANGVEQFLGVPTMPAYVLTGIWLLGLGVATARRRLGAAGSILVVWAALFVGMAGVTRIALGQASVAASRYSYLVLVLLITATVPLLPAVRRWHLLIPVGAGALWLVWVNASALDRNIEFWESRSLASRGVVEAAAFQLDRGEPGLVSALVDEPRAGMLSVSGLADLVRDGWKPPPPDDPADAAEGRGHLRIDLRPWSGGGSAAGCETTSGVTSTDPGDAPSGIIAESGGVRIVYEDEYGTGISTIEPPRRHSVRFLESNSASIRIEPESSVQLCVLP